MFTKESRLRPVIPMIEATHANCFDHPSCMMIMFDIQRLFKMETRPLVKESDMLFHSQTRTIFALKGHYELAISSQSGNNNYSKRTGTFSYCCICIHQLPEICKSLSAINIRILTECSVVKDKKKYTRIDGCAWKKCEGC